MSIYNSMSDIDPITSESDYNKRLLLKNKSKEELAAQNAWASKKVKMWDMQDKYDNEHTQENLEYMHALQLLKKHNVTVDSTGNILEDIGLPSGAYYNPITRTINYSPLNKESKRLMQMSSKEEYTNMIMNEIPHAIQADSLGTAKFLKNTFQEGLEDVITNKSEETGLDRYDDNTKIEGHAHNVLKKKLIDERNKTLGYAQGGQINKMKKYGGWLNTYQDGGKKLPDDFNKFQEFNKTLPDNLRDDNFKYGDYTHYDLYGMWDASGKPKSFDNVKDTENFPLQEDGTYHGFSVGNDGIWLKPKSHPSSFMEYMQGQLNPDSYFKNNHVIQREDGRLQYVPTTLEGHAQGGQVNNNQKQNDMGSLYYMSGGWHSKNKYATGGTTLPYQMYPEYEDASGTNYDTTKKVASAIPALTQAGGVYGAAAGVIGTVAAAGYDIAKSKENNKLAHNRNLGVGKQVEDINFANSPYSQDGGYGQYNDSGIKAAKGGPIWYMLTKDPENFQVNQNNNQFKRGGAIYAQGGRAGDNQASGVVPGGPNDSTTEDNKVVSNVKKGSFVIPANKIDEIEPYLLQVGIDPNKKIASENINANSSISDKDIIHASKDERVLAPREVKLIESLVGGPEGMERKFSPNSPHNIYAAMGGKIGNNYYQGGPPSFTDELEGVVSSADKAQAALDATRAAEAARIANNEPVPVVPIKLPPPAAAAPVVPPASQKTMKQLVDENDAIGKTDEMTEEARRQNKTMLGINTAKAAGMGIWNALQKNPEMPKQGRFNPMLISSNTEAMGAEQNYLSAKAGATARRAATEGNINQTVSNASIQANTLAQQVTDANQRSAIDQRVNEANVGTLNQASLYNLQADNQYNQMAAERTALFKKDKATAISGNINDAAKGYNNYANANLGINALEKGYNSGKINQALYQKAMNNPESLTPEEIIQLNSITGGNFNPANLS